MDDNLGLQYEVLRQGENIYFSSFQVKENFSADSML